MSSFYKRLNLTVGMTGISFGYTDLNRALNFAEHFGTFLEKTVTGKRMEDTGAG